MNTSPSAHKGSKLASKIAVNIAYFYPEIHFRSKNE